MKTLYILGNGFDLHHGLKTRYADFHRFVAENHHDLETTLENYFNFQVDPNYLWKNFEGDLCEFNYKGFFVDLNHLDIMDDSFKPSQCFGLEDDITQQSEDLVQDIREAFLNWIESIEYPDKDQVPIPLLQFHPGSLFINFNYTDTLEELYRISKDNILYPHNNANDFSGDLIFGHGEKEEKDPKEDELDANGDSNRTMFTHAEDTARAPFYAFQKDTDTVLADHKDFFAGLSETDQVIVLGHSLGKVDWPYFQKIATIAPTAVWSISYHPVEAKLQMKFEAIKMLDPKKPIINMILMEELG
jgi:hypothetical protein